MFKSYLIALLLQCLLILYPASACVLPTNTTTSSTAGLIVGEDPPADPATLGWTINHLALLINNHDAMLDFYGRILGMRHIFTYNASPDYSITYLGHSHGGKNGTGFQRGDELLREKANVEGLLELVYYGGSRRNSTSIPTASTVTTNTFGHIGVVVPDVKAAQSRMQDNGVRILKAVGEDLPSENSAATRALGLGGDMIQARVAALAGIKQLGFAEFLLVADPDGNLVEIQNQS